MLFFNQLQDYLPSDKAAKKRWSGLHAGSSYLAIADAVLQHPGLNLLVCANNAEAIEAETSLPVYLEDKVEILAFPDWETLPYDQFSPHQDIISQRLETLSRLEHCQQALLICSVNTLMHRISPKQFIHAQSFSLKVGQAINVEHFIQQLSNAGYRRSDTVYERGEFAVRGAIVDLFPMGSDTPLRIDLFDEEIDTLRNFDVESQRTQEQLESFNILPAKEFPFNEESIRHFKHAWQNRFDVDYRRCPIYQDISEHIVPGGIEYYLELFFDSTSTLFDYLNEDTLLFVDEGVQQAADSFWQEIGERHESLSWDVSRPILAPEKVFINPEQFQQQLSPFKQVILQKDLKQHQPERGHISFDINKLPHLAADPKHEKQLHALESFLSEMTQARVLICAESSGRREQVLELLKQNQIDIQNLESVEAFFNKQQAGVYLCLATLHQGYWIKHESQIASNIQLESTLRETVVITETEIYDYRISQERRRAKQANQQSADLIIKNLSELTEGTPVVHIDHGVGRYRGLENLTIDQQEIEFLCLEYANQAKLYVPVSSLHLISRYSAGADEGAPLHSLGSDQWQKARKKAADKIHDVAAELLDIYARRAAVKGFSHRFDQLEYQKFAADFPFEETDDQLSAIHACITDMQSEQPMDRLVCGDVGFGKTEVAMRAAFVALQNNKQVAVLVPTTLLAEQHEESFQDRFAGWPVRIASLSRFKTAAESRELLEELAEGKLDIVIGTHKLLQKDVRFKDLGLIIIDEEHRFGVRHKEKLNSLRSNTDILTLTATPIPRTLNMAMSGMRDISIIATPPAKRLSIKTFVHSHSNAIVKEAVHRELLRGGQVFYLHNEVSSIEKSASDLAELIPEARISIAHGQMREKQLEKVMSDFYHKQSNILVCTTIIETGIDIPSANTIIIDRADKLGLAQLHQLRGRVGRSHHQAYAYLLTPHHKAMSADAIKRLEAIQEATNLGAGFTLASHDLEIRGAGELLGDEQSGNMHAIGFTLYMDMLEEAVRSIKSGKLPEKNAEPKHGTEINLGLPALIPDDYLPDVHLRLLLYKRIASASNNEELSELQVEMIDRFGLLPDQVKLLMEVTRLKIKATPLGIRKIDANAQRGKITFNKNTPVEPINIVKLVQEDPQRYRLDGADKLQFIFDMQDYGARIGTIDTLLTQLSRRSTASQ